ncbi:MAG: GyrI-like domain-containing protein [Clostridia bacterium]|nr:GyrI-like domain-containing protein [Clostridia bacterium]
MAFDYKKEYKEFYLPKAKPAIIAIPAMHFLAVRGCGDPNQEGGAYKAAVGALYAIAFTIKMSKMGAHRISGYFDYVMPPLEGFWRQEGTDGFDPARKRDLCWISVIRLPEFVTRDVFDWAVREASAKKREDFSAVEYLRIAEGLTVQCMHIGPYDDEPRTLAAMHAFAAEQGYVEDFSPERLHHEIYLSDPRRCNPAKLKTIIRLPIRKA